MAKDQMRDVIIIGAGVTGIYTLHKLLQQGLNVTVLETADGPGGTWFWNNYPGARFDSESYSYGYSFSREIYDEWNWSEHFAGQKETLSYLEFVVDKLGIKDHMQFGCTVKKASFDEGNNTWTLELTDGRAEQCRYLCTAIGLLSAATYPNIEGLDSFEGEAHHTYYWPNDRDVELAERKVAVIGTGATGVQVISEIADKVGELTVFQRRPNWCAPLHNSPISEEEQTKLKASFDDIFSQVRSTHGGFIHGIDSRSFYEVSEEDRNALWEDLYSKPGFGVWLSNFAEVYLLPEANAEYSDFIANKIRSRVEDPAVAEKLIPKDHGFGSRRVPLETKYFEAYNRDNVRLVDVNETPIERITPRGVKTTEEDFDFDLIIYATGFDAITGAFDRMEIEGVGGEKLADKWKDGPITSYGIQVTGFPNAFFLAGPQSGSVASNFPPAIEAVVDWTTDLIAYLNDKGLTRIEADQAAEDEWTAGIKQSYEGSLLASAKSWFTGYNSNVEGHDKLRYMIYLGGLPSFKETLVEIAAKDYEGFKQS
jgi:cation diffusion facilitator CzcD-associated flavoprotein CzcO